MSAPTTRPAARKATAGPHSTSPIRPSPASCRPASRTPSRARAGRPGRARDLRATDRARPRPGPRSASAPPFPRKDPRRPAPGAVRSAQHPVDDPHSQQEAQPGREPDEPVHAAQGRLEAHELAVRGLEIGEDLVFVEPGRHQLADLLAHVGGHGGGRIADGEALADRTAQDGGDPLGLGLEGGPGEPRPSGRAGDGGRVREVHRRVLGRRRGARAGAGAVSGACAAAKGASRSRRSSARFNARRSGASRRAPVPPARSRPAARAGGAPCICSRWCRRPR